jgi:1,2-phenylacetyl-CoA epoxidase catalytic subunit
MSQDKLGHARHFYEVAAEVTGRSKVELQFDRDVDSFRWNPAWTASLDTWAHLVLAQAAFGHALRLDLEAVEPETRLAEPLAKIQQEDAWHTQHADAWFPLLEGHDEARAALDELWPYIVGAVGVDGAERFPEDLEAGVRTRTDDELRQDLLDEVVPRLEDVGLDVPAAEKAGAWDTDPAPTEDLLDQLRERARPHATELTGLLQDPEARELAELA